MDSEPKDSRPSIPPDPTSALCRIFLVRHGRTILNAQGRFRGREDPPLDEVGRQEAHRVAERLTGSPLDAVYSSPLLRARETAAAIASAHGLPVQRVPGLRDLDYGAWSGRTADEAARSDRPTYRLFRADPMSATPPGGESVNALSERVLTTLQRIALDHERDTVAVVSHELPIRLILARATGARSGELWGFSVPTGSVHLVLVGRSIIRRAQVARIGAAD